MPAWVILPVFYFVSLGINLLGVVSGHNLTNDLGKNESESGLNIFRRANMDSIVLFLE